jgi:cytochrome b561
VIRRRWRNSARRYGAVAIAFHWLMALLLLALIALGLWLVRLPDAGYHTVKIMLILYHKEIGVLAFAVAALRLAWRLVQRLPALEAGLPQWQQLAARLVHLCLYGLMFALPLTGWLMSSAAGFTVSFLGLADLPDLVPASDALFRELAFVHRWLAYALLALIAAHAGAALRHHFILGDATLSKMLSAARRRTG